MLQADEGASANAETPDQTAASIAIISAYKRNVATTIDARIYQSVLEELGHRTRWYQCVDNSPKEEYYLGDSSLRGLGTPFRNLNLAANLWILWPRGFRSLSEDVLLVTDQVLTRVVDYSDRCIILVHDLREVSGAETHVYGKLLFRFLTPKLAKARALFAVSEYTKTQIENLVPNHPPIFVLPHTTQVHIDPMTHCEDALHRIQTERTLRALYPVVDRPYKNLNFLVDLARYLESRPSPVRFLFKVRPPLRKETVKKIEAGRVKSLATYQEVENPSDLYSMADTMIFPSLHEGFGKPLIEAMECGIPIVASDIQPIREVVGSGGLLLPPNDLTRWADAVLSLSDPATYRKWANAARERSVVFSRSLFKERLRDALQRALQV